LRNLHTALKKSLATIEKASPDYIITECAACKMQIEHLTGKRVLHPIMVLAKNL
jgi:Fe-S oxidoreductase